MLRRINPTEEYNNLPCSVGAIGMVVKEINEKSKWISNLEYKK